MRSCICSASLLLLSALAVEVLNQLISSSTSYLGGAIRKKLATTQRVEFFINLYCQKKAIRFCFTLYFMIPFFFVITYIYSAEKALTQKTSLEPQLIVQILCKVLLF